jgi:hypothetical protein
MQTTVLPPAAAVWAIAEPMTPAPTTPTFVLDLCGSSTVPPPTSEFLRLVG